MRQHPLGSGPPPCWRAFLHCLLIGGLVSMLPATWQLQSASAQGADAVDVIDENAEDAADAAEPAGGDNGQQSTSEEEKPQKRPGKSYLEWAWGALGIGYSLVFLSLSFILVALLVMNLLAARRENVVPVALVEEFETHINENRFQEAYDLSKGDESMLGQVLAAGMSKLKIGYPQAIEAMQEVGEEENMKLEHRLSYMALIGTISPMIGLLGTVQGIIGAFSVIATTSSGAPDAQELAGELSTALFTTLVGLAIAIPAIAAYNILRNRIARLTLEVGIVSEGLMSRFQNMGTKKS